MIRKQFSKEKLEDVNFFRKVLGDDQIVIGKDALESSNSDWTGKYVGKSEILLKPTQSTQVSEILRYCNERNLAVVPQGGNTGLVGGSVPVFDEVIINLEDMNKSISFDEVSGVVVCEAGCTLGNLNNFLAPFSFMVPLDLGPKFKCQIGGNVSTNAGGLRFVRYGSLHGSILGLEVVLSDGTVLDLLSTLRKDNTGYDLKQIFIGAEGTLGIVTRVSFLAVQKPSSVQLAFLGCDSFPKLKGAFLDARRHFGEIMSAVEFLDSFAMQAALTHLEGATHPIPNSDSNFYLLLETSGSNEKHDREKLEQFLESAMAKGLVESSVLAETESQAKSFWQIRVGMAAAIKQMGLVFKYDISLPMDRLYTLVEVMRDRLSGEAVVVAWGHFGDGNVHLNIISPQRSVSLLERIEPFIYEWTSKNGGSISAEHGLGQMKAEEIHYSKKPEAVALMHRMKELLDPKGILNPYKVLPNKSAAV